MARKRRSLLSENTKIQLAQMQGAGDRVSPGYYGNLTSKEAGSLVKFAIAFTEQTLAAQTGNSPAPFPQQ